MEEDEGTLDGGGCISLEESLLVAKQEWRVVRANPGVGAVRVRWGGCWSWAGGCCCCCCCCCCWGWG